MKLYEELVWRNLIKDVSNEEHAKKLLNAGNSRFYIGFDPTGESLTVGHLVQIVRMRLLQTYGHTPVVLIGGATGLIGDPRATSERTLLTLEQSLKNAELIKKQISKYLDPKETIYVNNYDWIKEIDMISFLRDYGKHFNVNYMLAKETIQTRLETGISYTEFSYMLIQAIDFLKLYENQNVEIQFGGSDQWGNITTGLELIRKVKGKNTALGISSPLLLKSDGEKFGKSESGAIWLDRDLTSPYEMYQYFYNTADSDVSNYLKSLTLLSKDEIIKLEKATAENPGNRLAQKRLAEEVVKFVHGNNGLEEALLITESLFNEDFKSLTLNAFKDLEKSFDVLKININDSLIEILKDAKLAQSNREAREFINNGAITINGNKVADVLYEVQANDLLYDKYIILKRGKRRMCLLIAN